MNCSESRSSQENTANDLGPQSSGSQLMSGSKEDVPSDMDPSIKRAGMGKEAGGGDANADADAKGAPCLFWKLGAAAAAVGPPPLGLITGDFAIGRTAAKDSDGVSIPFAVVTALGLCTPRPAPLTAAAAANAAIRSSLWILLVASKESRVSALVRFESRWLFDVKDALEEKLIPRVSSRFPITPLEPNPPNDEHAIESHSVSPAKEETTEVPQDPPPPFLIQMSTAKAPPLSSPASAPSP